MLGIVAACAGIVPGRLEEISVAPAAPPKTARAFRRLIVRFDFSDNFTFLDDMIVLLFVNDYPDYGGGTNKNANITKVNALPPRSHLPFVLPWKHCLPITGRKTPYKYLGFDVKFSAAGSVGSYCHKIFDPRPFDSVLGH